MTQNAPIPQRKTMTRRELFHIFRSKPHKSTNADVGADTRSPVSPLQYSQYEENSTSLSNILHDNNSAIDANTENSDTHHIAEESAPQHIFTNLPPEFASLYRQEAEKKGLTISDDAMQEASSAFLKNFWGQCP